MITKSIRIFYTVNLTQYRRLQKIAKRTAKLTGRKQPGDFLLSDYLQPEAHLLIDNALTQMEKDLDEAEIRAYDPFNDPIWKFEED